MVITMQPIHNIRLKIMEKIKTLLLLKYNNNAKNI